MDDLRRRFATLDAVPAQIDWPGVERRVAAVASSGAKPASVAPTSVRRAPRTFVRPAGTRQRSVVLLVAAALVATMVAGVVGFGGLLDRNSTIVVVSPSPSSKATSNPTTSPTVSPSPSDTPTESAAAACPGVEAPKELRVSTVELPGKTSDLLGPPLVVGCEVWVTSGANGGGIHRIDLATGKVTNSNPAEIVWDVDTDGRDLWAIGVDTPHDASPAVLYQLDPATGATIRKLTLSDSQTELKILDGRAWVGGFMDPLDVIDLATGDLVASVQIASRDIQVGAGGVWSGMSRIDPVTFEVTDLQTTFLVNRLAIVGDRLYGVDQEHGRIAQIDPVTGRIVTSIQLDDWSAGLVAVERDSIWVLQVKEPPSLPLKPYPARLVRIDGATGQIADRIAYDVLGENIFWATEGNLWLTDQPTSRLRHGFIRFELPGTR